MATCGPDVEINMGGTLVLGEVLVPFEEAVTCGPVEDFLRKVVHTLIETSSRIRRCVWEAVQLDGGCLERTSDDERS
jgi:hypothetical protein